MAGKTLSRGAPCCPGAPPFLTVAVNPLFSKSQAAWLSHQALYGATCQGLSLVQLQGTPLGKEGADPGSELGSLAASRNRLAQRDLKSAGEEYHSALTRQGHQTGMSLVNVLRESSQSQKDKDNMVPLGQGTLESPIHRASRLVGGGYWLTDEQTQTRLGCCNLTVNYADSHPTHPRTVMSANKLDT